MMRAVPYSLVGEWEDDDVLQHTKYVLHTPIECVPFVSLSLFFWVAKVAIPQQKTRKYDCFYLCPTNPEPLARSGQLYRQQHFQTPAWGPVKKRALLQNEFRLSRARETVSDAPRVTSNSVWSCLWPCRSQLGSNYRTIRDNDTINQ